MTWQTGGDAEAVLSDQDKAQLAAMIRNDIDSFSIATYRDDEERSHLGASLIGDDCAARLWYGFRWFKGEEHSGRMLRLFNRGHETEPRLVGWLRGIGFDVQEFDAASGKQWRMNAVAGHFGGSLDGRLGIPERYLAAFAELRKLPGFLLEMKTHNTKSFVHLVNKTVRVAKPQHYAQMCCYGRAYGYRYGLYVAVNKNDDDIYIEVVELDFKIADSYILKAQDIINARVRPAQVAKNAAFFQCKTCVFADICHNGAKGNVNCRSCAFAVPVEGGEWRCERFNGIIPKDFIKTGCPSHQFAS